MPVSVPRMSPGFTSDIVEVPGAAEVEAETDAAGAHSCYFAVIPSSSIPRVSAAAGISPVFSFGIFRLHANQDLIDF